MKKILLITLILFFLSTSLSYGEKKRTYKPGSAKINFKDYREYNIGGGREVYMGKRVNTIRQEEKESVNKLREEMPAVEGEISGEKTKIRKGMKNLTEQSSDYSIRVEKKSGN